jgi:hypothetical protein
LQCQNQVPADEPVDQRVCDTQQYRNNMLFRILSGHDELGIGAAN